MVPPEIPPMINYFKDTLIRHPQQRQDHRIPRFLHKMCNCFDLSQTNNSIRGWHRPFKLKFLLITLIYGRLLGPSKGSED